MENKLEYVNGLLTPRDNKWLLISEIDGLVHSLDDYEATIVLAYIKRLIKSREGQTING